MSNSTWVRFATTEGTILGEVTVPSKPPAWFVPILAKMNEGSARAITMEDISAEEWLEHSCSNHRPIWLDRPLAPQQQEELVFFKPGNLNKMSEELKKISTEQKIEPRQILRDDNFIRKFAYFMEDVGHLSPAEREELQEYPRSKIQPERPVRRFVFYRPLIEVAGSPPENRDSMRLVWSRVNHYVTMRADASFVRQVDHAYAEETSTLLVGAAAERATPATPASPASPASRPTIGATA